MMPEKKVDELIAGFLSNQLKDGDLELLHKWLNEDPENQVVIENLITAHKLLNIDTKSRFLFTDTNYNRIWEKLYSENKKNKEKRTRLFNYLRKIAASFGLVVIVSFIGYFFHTQFNSGKSDNGAIVEKTVKETLAGQKSTVFLPDGTKVILNSESKIEFDEFFQDLHRVVRLSGEAFFEVTKDPVHPFKVITGNVTTTALGTSFNISAYRELDIIDVALVTGKVSVRHQLGDEKTDAIDLNPGEMAVISNSGKELTKKMFDFNDKIAWKDGIIYFNDANFSTVVHKLKKWYGAEIEIRGAPAEPWEFSGIFEDESLENILISLKYGYNFDFELNGKNAKIIFHDPEK